MCQQISKEPETKKQNNHNHWTNNLTGNKEAGKNNRQRIKKTKSYNFNKSSKNK